MAENNVRDINETRKGKIKTMFVYDDEYIANAFRYRIGEYGCDAEGMYDRLSDVFART